MKRIGFAAGLIWLAAGFTVPCTASTRTSHSPKRTAHVHKPLPKPTIAPRVSESSARSIAWRSGLDHIEEITLSGDLWEVAGRDRAGNEKVLDIHVEDGRVLN
ncbi:hypothetical protein [Bosea sp. 124]|uniref:hypothetical protein n=1 Tax=Bosea sp. 124 TaxID=2135642 RepID=UPI000D49351B|nr:hypothetical protein [Bosea sp. 124]PTM42251.1 hypothetical protein C8D03_3834 [Bosea sp. 124]